MFKKIPWKNILIVFTAMLVVPVIAFAMTTTADPKEPAIDANDSRNITITSDEKTPDAASEATSVLTSGALGYLDGATAATVADSNSDGRSDANTDAVSSATGEPGATGSISDDDEYDDDDESYKEDEDEEDTEDEEDEEDEEDDEDDD